MKDNYSFPGEVTLSVEEYTDLILDLHKAQKDAEAYWQAYKDVKQKYDDLLSAPTASAET